MDDDSSPGLLARRVHRWVEPEAVFARLCRSGAAAVWFDGGVDGAGDGGFIGLAPADPDVVLLHPSAPGSRTPAEELAPRLRTRSAAAAASSPVLGWWGWLTYEFGNELHDLAPAASDAPTAAFAFMDRGLVFDRTARTVTLSVLASAPDARSWLAARAGELEEQVGVPAREAPPSAPDGPWRWRHPRAEYLELIHRCQAAITRGDAYQLCLTNEISVDLPEPIDPLEVYLRLRERMTTRFGGVLRIGERWLLSGSPELYLSVDPHGVATTRPMKGTRPRGADAERDARLMADLVGSEKERAENLMIVDLMRNDLSRVSEIGSVEVPQLFGVETYRSVHQLVSTVRSVLDVDAIAAALALFPAGSMTGAPKRSAMQELARLEGGPRGVYSGVWGRLPLDGTAELAVVIRSIVLMPGRASIGSGGGITALSVPEEEWLEIELKARPMLAAIGARPPG